MIWTDAPSDQKSLPYLIKYPASSVKNSNLKRHTKLTTLDPKKFRVDYIYKLLRQTLQVRPSKTVSLKGCSRKSGSD